MKNSNYRLVDLIGEGQFGRVFLGINRQTGELFALKELNQNKISTKKFLREIEILLTLNHPNIISFQGIEHQEGKRYLITEYCEGGTLRELIDSQFELNLKQKLELVIDILNGLNHIHYYNIIHRDLKPENILLTLISHGWRAKITDFGVAKTQKDGDRQNTSLGDTGSPAYMAPEQFYSKYSYTSDIYSIGIILYELLLGERPFSGNPNQIMLAHLNQLPIIADYLPLSLQNILHKALAKLPQHRFKTAKEMLLAIQEVYLNVGEHNIYLEKNNQIEKNKNIINLLNHQIFITKKLDKNVKKVISNQKKIYIIEDNKFTIYEYEFDHNLYSLKEKNCFQFEQEIIDIYSYEEDLIIVTKKSNKLNNQYYFDKITNGNQNNLLSITAKTLIYSLDSRQKWLAYATEIDTKKGFQIINLTNQQTIQPLLEEIFPNQLIAIDKHHALAIFNQNEKNNYKNTLLKIFTRKGRWIDTFIINLFLTNLSFNLEHPNYLLAIEKNDQQIENFGLILIRLKPFKITRIPEIINPNLIACHPLGFMITDKIGKIMIINLMENNLSIININQPILSIDYLSNEIILVATSCNQKNGQLGELLLIENNLYPYCQI